MPTQLEQEITGIVAEVTEISPPDDPGPKKEAAEEAEAEPQDGSVPPPPDIAGPKTEEADKDDKDPKPAE